MGSDRFTGFGTGALQFFEELAVNNDRAWWQANKARYETEVRAPLELLLDGLAAEFGEAKVFRPNRDTRFSKDKSPYKTSAAAVVGDPEGGVGTLYVQLTGDGLMTGGGSYHPAKDQLARMREAIADDRRGAELEGALDVIRKAGGSIVSHDALKTAPRGYPADHPRIDLLRRKGITGMVEHPPARWLHTAEALERVAEDWRLYGPLNAWLADHVGPSQLPPERRR